MKTNRFKYTSSRSGLSVGRVDCVDHIDSHWQHRTCLFFAAILLISGMLLISCNKPGCAGKAGHAGTRQVSLSDFDQVELHDNIDLVLVQGSANSMEISGPENIIPEISTNITGGKLVIRNEASCRWARDPSERLKVTLTFVALQRLIFEAAGDVSNSDTLHLDALDIQSNVGAGNIELTVDTRYTGVFINQENAGVKIHGSSLTCNTYCTARGQLDLSDFSVSKMIIEYGGLADTRVNVKDELSVIIYYKGNVFYHGNPLVTQLLYYSAGRLIRD